MSNVNDFIDRLKEWGRRASRESEPLWLTAARPANSRRPHMHRHLAPFAADAKGWKRNLLRSCGPLSLRFQRTHYSHKPYLNTGSYFAEVVRQRTQEAGDSIERRFNALLTAHPQDLYHLRQAIAFLHGQSEATIAINWGSCFGISATWTNDLRPQVQEKWATSFWRHKARSTEQTDQPIEN